MNLGFPEMIFIFLLALIIFGHKKLPPRLAMPELAAAAPPAGQPEESMPAMSFLEHLEELRRRIIYAIIAVAVGFFACWGFAERIYAIIQKPLIEVLKRHNLPEK